MNVFKYRSGNKDDLDALFNNYFYSPLAADLNDPFETFIDEESYKGEITKYIRRKGKQNSKIVQDNLNKFIGELENLLDRLNQNVGYYSLTSTHLNEMMWALYSNSHKGFCLEYDLDELLKSEGYKYRYKINIQYNDRPPVLKKKDFDMIKTDKGKSIYSKKGGSKSLAWAHEKEVRIITDEIGRNSHSEEALKAVYFGVRMDDKQKEFIIKNVKGSKVKFYQMELIKETYELIHNPY